MLEVYELSLDVYEGGGHGHPEEKHLLPPSLGGAELPVPRLGLGPTWSSGVSLSSRLALTPLQDVWSNPPEVGMANELPTTDGAKRRGD